MSPVGDVLLWRARGPSTVLSKYLVIKCNVLSKVYSM